MSATFAENTPGPRVIVTARNSCSGCPSLELKEWMDYLENDETDAGISARCTIANKSITAYWNERYAVPEFCKLEAVNPPDTQFLRAENVRLKNSLTELERHLIDARGEIDRVRLSAKKQDEAKYLPYQL